MQPAVFSALMSKDISSVKEKDLSTDQDIVLGEDMIVCLKPMKDIIIMLCSESKPTLSVVKPILAQLVGSLTQVNEKDSTVIQEMEEIMRKV